MASAMRTILPQNQLPGHRVTAFSEGIISAPTLTALDADAYPGLSSHTDLHHTSQNPDGNSHLGSNNSTGPERHQTPWSGLKILYSTMPVTAPAPTVRPPSRIAKRRPSSMAIGAIRVTLIFTLSPGITISTPSGSSQEPVTSVVRK